MRKLQAVEIARQLMTEGKEWGVWRWLLEKQRVRDAADLATQALAEARDQAAGNWSDELKKAYAGKHLRIDPATRETAQRVKDADDEAARLTAEAESMFADAERRMSASMARDAAAKALESYDARERAIRKAEAAARAGRHKPPATSH